MPNKRSYTDDQLREAVASSISWTQVLVALGKKPGSGYQWVQATAERLELDTSHFFYKRNFRPVQAEALPFSNAPAMGGRSGLSMAARWFLDRGYVVSVPLEPAVYDLITESDEGLKRVQVKTSRQIAGNGRRLVNISRLIYDPSRPHNANGPRRRAPYDPGSIDYFFIVTPGQMYLIPIGAVAGLTQLTLDDKYAAFAIS
jgi:hypothetical protein